MVTEPIPVPHIISSCRNGGRCSYLGVVELEESLKVTDEVGVDALQRFEQRNSGQFAVGLFIAALLIEMQAAVEGNDHS